MATYEYRCRTCGHLFMSIVHGLDKRNDVGHCLLGDTARIYSFVFHRPMQPHYNPGLGKYVSNKQEIYDDQRQQEERQFNQTGIEHSYATADLRDRDVFPITTEGLESTYDAHGVNSPVRRAIETVE